MYRGVCTYISFFFISLSLSVHICIHKHDTYIHMHTRTSSYVLDMYVLDEYACVYVRTVCVHV